MRSKLLAVIVLASCGGAPAQQGPNAVEVVPAVLARPATPAKVVTNDVDIEVRDVTLAGAMGLFARRFKEPVSIDVRSMPFAVCKRFAMKIGVGFTSERTLDVLDALLSDSGLHMVRNTGAGFHEVVADQEKAPCSTRAALWTQWIQSGVTRKDETHFQITKPTLELWTKSFFIHLLPGYQGPPPGKKGIVLREDGGVGVRLYEAIGFKADDLVVSIQGEPLGLEGDTSVYLKKIREAERFSVDIERAGKPMTLSYEVTPGAKSPITSRPDETAAAAPLAGNDHGIEAVDVSLHDLVSTFAQRIGEPIRIDLSAVPHLKCAKTTVRVGPGYTKPLLLDILDALFVGVDVEMRKEASGLALVAPQLEAARGCLVDRSQWADLIKSGLKKIDDTTFEITRPALELFVTNFFDYYPNAVSPPDGKKGLKIVAGKGSEVAFVIGLEADDVVTAILDEPMGWSAKIARIQKKAIASNVVTISVERRSKPIKLTYRVVP